VKSCVPAADRASLSSGKAITTIQRIAEAPHVPWLVLRTRSHHENIVERSLQQKEIDKYQPRHRVVRRGKDRRTTLELHCHRVS
jgi:hypothetical protein